MQGNDVEESFLDSSMRLDHLDFQLQSLVFWLKPDGIESVAQNPALTCPHKVAALHRGQDTSLLRLSLGTQPLANHLPVGLMTSHL